MIKLYDFERSGNCYKVRLMLSLLGLQHEKITVDLSKGDQKKPEFQAMNPAGLIPVLDDNGVVIRDSQAILVYLGAKYGQSKWYPKSPKGQGKVQQWLSLSSHEVAQGLAASRAIGLGFRQGDAAPHQATGRKVLDILEKRLLSEEWLVGGKPTVADVACYPYVAMAPQGGIALDGHQAVRKWIRRVESLEGFVPLPVPPKKPA